MFEEFAAFSPLPTLLKAGEGRVTLFAKLPKTHQLALIHYMSVDGAAWAVDHSDFPDWKWGEGKSDKYRKEQLRDCNKFLPRFVKHFGRERFGLATIPTKDLFEVLRKHHPDFSDIIPNNGKKRGAYGRPTWPSILDDSEEILQDGWTRFFDRLALNIKMTPVVWYAK